MTAIGDLQDYVVLIQDCTDPTNAFTDAMPIRAEVPFSSLSWGRRESDVSKAVVSTDLSCVDGVRFQGWDDVISVYRNGSLQWCGPIVGWTKSLSGEVEVVAHDIFAWAAKRFIYADIDATNEDVWSFLGDAVSDIAAASSEYAPWFLINPDYVHPAQAFGVGLSLSVKSSELRLLSELLTTLVEEYGLFYTALPTGGWYDDAALELKVPLTEKDIVGGASMVVDCLPTARTLFLPRDRAGASGFIGTTSVTFSPSVIAPYSTFVQQAMVEEMTKTSDASVSELRARQLRAFASRFFPVVTLESVQLSGEFGSAVSGFNGMSTLIPGLTIDWNVADLPLEVPVAVVAASGRPNRTDILVDPTSYLTIGTTSVARLTELDVNVSVDQDGVAETISALFIPWAEPSA